MNPVGKPGKTGALMPVEVALARLLEMAEATPILERERLPLAAAQGRVLADDLISTLDLPPWPNSAMDGYALRASDWKGEPLVVSQRIFAGQAPEPLAPGTCARIFTGAPVPAGADCVEMQENAQVQADERVSFTEPLGAGQNIRPQGQETTVGECVLVAGTQLGPIELGLAASWVALSWMWYAACGSPCSPRVTNWSNPGRRSVPGRSTTATGSCFAAGCSVWAAR